MVCKLVLSCLLSLRCLVGVSEPMALSEATVKTLIATYFPNDSEVYYNANGDRRSIRIRDLFFYIAKRESSFNPEVIGDGGASYGLFQIHTPSWENELRSEGIINDKTDLLNPTTNTQAAAYIYKKSGFTPWSTWEMAVNDIETGGQLGPDPGTGTTVGDTLEDIQQGLNPLNALNNLIGIITSADFWKRIGLGALGFFIIVAAIIFWNKDELQQTVGAIK